MPPENGNEHQNLQVYREDKERAERRQEEMFLEHGENELKNLVEETGELLVIDNDERKQIENKLGPNESKAFLAEIKNADIEFKKIMLEYNTEIKNLTKEEYKEKAKLFFEKFYQFKNKREPLFEKIDELDGDKLAFLIEDTKFNPEKHEGFWNSFDAATDGLANGVLLGAQKYQDLFTGGFDGITKMVNSISTIVEEQGVIAFLEMIGNGILEDAKKMLDFDQPVYKIAQTIGKLLLDIIIQVISGGIGIVGKMAKVLDKIIPDGLIKNGIVHKGLETSGKIIGESVGIKSEKLKLGDPSKLVKAEGKSNFLSLKTLKELGIKGEASRLTNELLYYSGATPYIVFHEGRKAVDNIKDLTKWAIKTNKELAKNGYKIETDNLVSAITPNGDTVIKMVKLEKKLNPETKIAKEALKYFISVNNGLAKLELPKLSTYIKSLGLATLYEKRLDSYYKSHDEKEDKKLVQDFIGIIENKYKIKDEKYT